MRPGFKYVDVGSAGPARESVDATPTEFAETMGYAEGDWPTRDAFLAAHVDRWILELHVALVDLLEPERRVLSVGSGHGEHDVRLVLAGLDVTASDVVPGVLDRAGQLFPELKTMVFDVFDPASVSFEDVLVTGMDFYFEDAKVVEMLVNLRDLVGPGGRVLFTLRYPDTPATFIIDRALLPAIATVRKARGVQLRRKHHGWRRSGADVLRLGTAAGLSIGRIRRAGFGWEASRVGIDPDRVARFDRRTGWLTSATVFEFRA